MKSFITIVFLATSIYSYCQSFHDFENKYEELLSQYKRASNTYDNIEEFQDEVNSINQEVNRLINDIENFTNDDNSLENQELQNLMNQIKDFENFTQENANIDCINSFNNLISILGDNRRLIKEKENIRIYSSEIGNFLLIYAYSKDLATYRVNATINFGTFNRRAYQFNLLGNIHVIDICNKESYSFVKMNIVFVEKGNFYFNQCPEQFPRF